MEKLIAKQLAEKIGTSPSRVQNSFRHPSDSQLMKRIRDTLESTEISFIKDQKLSQGIKMSVNLFYKDKTKSSITVRKEFDMLPSEVREKFINTEEKRYTVHWNLPSII